MAPLDWLRTFLTVYRVGSIPGAAPRLDLTQPAVSQQIKALETRFRPRRRVARRPRRGRARGTPPPGGARLERGRGGRRLLLERLGDLRLAVVDGEEEEAHREGIIGRRRLERDLVGEGDDPIELVFGGVGAPPPNFGPLRG